MTPPPIRPQRSKDDIHVPFLVAALLLGVVGGFSLAVSLPFEALAGSVDVSWVAHAQVHGHLQVIGFAGLFVIGVSFKLAPRFGGRREMALAGVERWVLVFLVAGLLARALGQPLADQRAFGILMVLGAAAVATGAALYLAMIAVTLADACRQRQPYAILLVAAGVGFVVQAVLGLWWLSDMARENRVLMAARENAVLLHLQFFGFLLPAILGVGMRSFPTLFGRTPPGPVAGSVAAVFVIAGISVWTGAGVAAAMRGGAPWQWMVLGQALTGAGIVAAILTFGPWRRASRLAAASKGLAWAIHPALLWLALTGILLVLTAAAAAFDGRAVSSQTLDAIRHTFAIGVVTLAIVGMAQLILPEFASERLVNPPGSWRGPAFGLSLSLAAALRGPLLLVASDLGLGADARWVAMGAAGVIGWTATGIFAWLSWRALRSHRAYMQRITRARDHQLASASDS